MFQEQFEIQTSPFSFVSQNIIFLPLLNMHEQPLSFAPKFSSWMSFLSFTEATALKVLNKYDT